MTVPAPYREEAITCEQALPSPRWYGLPATREEALGILRTNHRMLVDFVGRGFFVFRRDTAEMAQQLHLPESVVYAALIRFRQEREKGQQT